MKNFGQNLVTSGHIEKAEIRKALTKLEDAKLRLVQAWDERKTTLDQALELQVLKPIYCSTFANAIYFYLKHNQHVD